MIKIIRINAITMDALSNDLFTMSDELKPFVVLVECQPYGKANKQFYHYAVAEEKIEDFRREIGGIEIPDTGRTQGFWQCLAAKGVFHKSILPDISGIKEEFLTSLEEAELTFDADTWASIINQMPEGFCDNLKFKE